MLRRLAAVVLLLVAAGCDSANVQQQQVFEAAAFTGASDGPTADDWRVAPFFGIGVQVTQPASPNPAAPSEPVSLQIFADDAAGGLALYRRERDGGVRLIQALRPEAGPNIYTFTFFGGDASTTGALGSARLIVLDGLDRVITYGDLVLR